MLPGSFSNEPETASTPPANYTALTPDPTPLRPRPIDTMATPDPGPDLPAIEVLGIVLTSSSTVADSVQTSKSRTEAFTLADRLKKVDDISTIVKLRPDNLTVWTKAIRNLIIMTDTAAVFLSPEDQNDCGEKSLAVWTSYWLTKLKEAAPYDYKVELSFSPLVILENILGSVTERSALRINAIAANFWSLRAKPDQSVSSFVKTLEERLTAYKQHFTFNTEVEIDFRAVLSYNLSILRPELALRCDDLSVLDTITELRKWAGREYSKPSQPVSTSSHGNNRGRLVGKACTFCQIRGHNESECRKKAGVKCTNCNLLGHTSTTCKKSSVANVPVTAPSISAVFQLDTAADETTTGNKELFTSYLPCTQTVTLANASEGRILGKGLIDIPAQPHPISVPAIHLEGCQHTLLSLHSLEKAGFHLHVPEDTNLPLQLRDNSRAAILHFKRKGPRFVWETPLLPQESWHASLGHVNHNYLKQTLQQHNIEPPQPIACTPCAQAKFARHPGSGHIIKATSKLEVIHLDLVGGKASLPPGVNESDVPAASYCLLLIDEYTRFKWQIPVYAKDDCPQLLKIFLQQLHTSFGRFPARLHSDRGSEFINGKIQDYLASNGIQWTGSAAYAHEQNGLIEGTVRTVFEALRATHIHANIPAKCGPTRLQQPFKS